MILQNRPLATKLLLLVVALIVNSTLFPQTTLAVPHQAAQFKTHQSPLQQSTGPDLTFREVTVTPSNSNPGSMVDVTGVIENRGDAPSGGFWIHLYVEPNDTPPTDETAHTARFFVGIGLGVGSTFRWSKTELPITSDDPNIYLWVDRDERVEESDENNNLYQYTVETPSSASDAYEDDDSCETAVTVAPDGVAQERNLHRENDAPDIDWIQIDATSGITYTVQTTAIGDDADIEMILLSNCGQAFGGQEEIIFQAERDGPYYIRISHVSESYGPKTSYQLVVTSDEAQTSIGPDGYEEDNTCGTAKEIMADGLPQERNLYQTDGQVDKDWVKLDAIQGVTYTIQAIAEGADTVLEMALIASCDVNAFGGDDEVTFMAQKNGLHYLKIRHKEDDYGLDTRYRLIATIQTGCTTHFEPNDRCLSASDLPSNGEGQTHSICAPAEEDWHRIAIQAGTTYRIQTDEVGANADIRSNLYRSCEEVTGFDSGPNMTYIAPASGFLYLKTTHIDEAVHGLSTDYTVRVEREGAGCEPDSFEPDNQKDEAQSITLETAKTHTFCPAEDQDWSRFEGVEGTQYTIETRNLSAQADTVLCLYDGDQNEIGCDNDSGPGNGSRLVWEAPSTGSYYLRVRAHDDQIAGPETQYDLYITTEACMRDAFEPNDTSADAMMIATDDRPQAHNICPAGDEDWLSFSAEAGYVTIETTSVGAEADTVIELYDNSSTSTALASNDDFTVGTASRLTYQVTTAGTYRVKVQLHNAESYGTGTDYEIRVKQSDSPPATPTPNPTATPPPTPTPTPTPQLAQYKTLILVNPSRLAELHPTGEVDQLIGKLDALAGHEQVQGLVLRLDQESDIVAAYAAWQDRPTSIDHAQQVTDAIRRLIRTTLDEYGTVEYLVLVGGDQALPFRRIVDYTESQNYTESFYDDIDKSHPTGAALASNHYLSDDYYADHEAITYNSHEIYIPDMAVGRLIETPEDIIQLIDTFLERPRTTSENILVTGYDFVIDTGNAICEQWQQAEATANINCDLIGRNWAGDLLIDAQLHHSPVYKVQAINGHADHQVEFTPRGRDLNASDVVAATSDLSGGLIYTLGCHAGLNIPISDSQAPLDLAETFAQKQANYVGGTGYSWGYDGQIGLSEQLMILYTQALNRGTEAHMGQALVEAKQAYYQEQESNLDGYDEKILMHTIFYGLPMWILETSASFSALGPEFTGVTMTPNAQPLSGKQRSSASESIVQSYHISFAEALASDELFTLSHTEDGRAYYRLNGHTSQITNGPILPTYYNTLPDSEKRPRSAIMRGGAYQIEASFAQAVAKPFNEFVTKTPGQMETSNGWRPAVPVHVQRLNDLANIVTPVSQYNTTTGQLLTYDDLDVDIYYSDSLDQTAPTISLVSGRLTGDASVDVKVEATDPYGVETVILSYMEDSTQLAGRIQSVELAFNPQTHKWTGSFTGSAQSRYFIQAVDLAGNVAVDSNKGQYYQPSGMGGGGPVPSAGKPEINPVINCENGSCLFLPLVTR